MKAGETWSKTLKDFLFKRKAWLWLVLGLVLLGLTRTINLARFPIFCDEAIYIRWSQIAWKEAPLRFISLTDGKQPFQTWITIPFLRSFNDPLVAGRAQAALAGLILPFVLSATTIAFFPKRKQLPIIVFFLAIFSPYLLFHNRMALAESFLTLFAAGSLFFSYLLAKTRRLDVALLAGAWLGFALLVKSQALFFLILFPLGIVFVPVNFIKKDFRQAFKFLGLFLISALIAYFIYNIQRLSGWMHLIDQKNQEFTAPILVALREWPFFWRNLRSSFSWFWVYLTWPVFLFSLVGLVLWLKRDWRQGLFLAGWFFLPFGAINLIARIYNSRYLAFLAFLPLLWAAFGLDQLRKKIGTRLFSLFMMLVLLLPLVRTYQLIFSPEQFPFTKTDRGYLEGWTAGYGIPEIVSILNQASQTQQVVVGTEGNFGLLSQGLEIYFAFNPNVRVLGFHPLPVLPPEDFLGLVQEGKRAFFVVNNTPGDFSQENFSLVAEFFKVNNQGSLRLYEVLKKN